MYNEFAAAVLRYGHSEIADVYNRSNPDGSLMVGSGLKFSTINFLVTEAYK